MKKAIMLLLAALCTAATSLAYDFQSGDLYYNITSNTTVEVTCQQPNYYNYQGLSTATIPETVTYNGTTYSVTSIGRAAFLRCSSLTSVTIPNSVTSIESGAFEYCSGLTSVTIPNSVTSIESGAFEYCSGLTSINLVTPSSITEIGNNAFGNTPWFTNQPDGVVYLGDVLYKYKGSMPQNTSVIVNSGTKAIGSDAFYGCSGLTSVTIPNSVTSIGSEAFRGCSGLTSVTIPNSVTSIGKVAFHSCSSLTSIVVESGNTMYDSRESCNAIIETASNTLIAGCQSTTIPNSVTSIGDYAFYRCSSLTSITIPNSVTSIGDDAFYRCSSLTSVTIPTYVTSIGDEAFYRCSSLTSVTIPTSVTSIGESAFRGCSSLTSVTIPNSVTSIGSAAFSNCVQLTSITCEANTPPSCDISMDGNSFKNIPANCTIKVPCGCLEAYSTAPWYNYQLTIIPPLSLQVQPSSESLGSTKIDQEVDCDSTAIVSATANYGYHFVQWSDSVTVNPRTIKLTNDTVLTAEFARNAYIITLTHEGEGAIEGDTTALYQDSVTLKAVADYGWQFSGWSDGVLDNTRTVVVSSDCEYHAIFVRQQFSLTAIAENGVVDGVGTFAYEDTCQLTATPITGYHFVQWSDGITDNPRSIVLTQDTNLIAEFARNVYNITLTQDGEGTIESDTTALYQDTIALNAVADYGWQFSSWSDGVLDNPRSIVVTADCEYHAIFVRQQFSLTAIAENGVVDGVGTFEYETTCQLTATPDFGYHFVQWSDGITDNPRSIVLTQDTNLTAEFAKNAYNITLTHEGAGTIEGDTIALYQDSVTLAAIADYGWQFSSWSDGVLDNPRSIVITADCAYQAIFVKRSFTITVAGENGTIEGAGTFEYETTCQLTATPDFGCHFAQWSDGITDNPRSIVLTQDTMFTAEFAKNYSGQCGDSLYWSYDTTTISITGSGAMYNYSDSLMPWYLFRDSITAVEMVNTATTIGDNAFANCSKLSKLTISEGIESVGANAFMGCTQLTNITCHPIIPPYAVTSSFENYDTYLRVPCSSKSQYMADAVWGQFKYIECIEEETDIESVESASSEQSVRKIYRDGNVYIIRDGEEYSILGQKL